MSHMMKAICQHRYGGPEVLSYQDLPRPKPGPGEVLVQIHAAGVNPVDWKTRSGSAVAKSYGERFPLVLGWDLAGVVAELAPDVDRFSVGHPVYGMIRFPEPGGTYAEYVAAPADQLLPKPENLTYLEAAALPLVSLTAWQALVEVAELSTGQSVLIHAAAGGVGHVAVQIARARGARVFGTASARNQNFLKDLGVDTVIDYKTTRFEDVVSGLDVVFDTLAGEVRDRSWTVLRENGFLTSIRSGVDQEAAARHKVRTQHLLVRLELDHLVEVNRLVQTGKLRPTIEACFPLQEAAQAHQLSEGGHVRGKIVLQVLTE